MIDRKLFDGMVKDAVANLYDHAALEAHPLLFGVIKPPTEYAGSKVEYVRQYLLAAIERLRPERKVENPSSLELRPYLILRRRYVDGMGLHELADSLALSDRQLRRDHHRAMQALTGLLWSQLTPGAAEQAEEAAGEEDPRLLFEVHKEVLDPRDTVLGVYQIFRHRLEEEGIEVALDLPEPSVSIAADRVILRQILISLFNDALHLHADGEMRVRLWIDGPQVAVEIDVPVGDGWTRPESEADPGALGAVRYWSERIGASIAEDMRGGAGERRAIRVLRLPRSDQKVILVVDDQLPAVNLFRRYLSQTGFVIVGEQRPDQVLAAARRLQPALITLDVMMPKMDGWEIIQTLKLDEETRRIPVVICSAWEEPELSHSLGAAAFLKKPVTQRDLIGALHQLGLF